MGQIKGDVGDIARQRAADNFEEELNCGGRAGVRGSGKDEKAKARGGSSDSVEWSTEIGIRCVGWNPNQEQGRSLTAAWPPGPLDLNTLSFIYLAACPLHNHL